MKRLCRHLGHFLDRLAHRLLGEHYEHEKLGEFVFDEPYVSGSEPLGDVTLPPDEPTQEQIRYERVAAANNWAVPYHRASYEQRQQAESLWSSGFYLPPDEAWEIAVKKGGHD